MAAGSSPLSKGRRLRIAEVSSGSLRTRTVKIYSDLILYVIKMRILIAPPFTSLSVTFGLVLLIEHFCYFLPCDSLHRKHEEGVEGEGLAFLNTIVKTIISN